jgi:hypothetical protein
MEVVVEVIRELFFSLTTMHPTIKTRYKGNYVADGRPNQSSPPRVIFPIQLVLCPKEYNLPDDRSGRPSAGGGYYTVYIHENS